MAGGDDVLFNNLERALSTDMNDLQAVSARSFIDSWRAVNLNPLTAATKDAVLGGLVVIPNGADVVISSGALVQNAPNVSPLPGPLDSSYRIGIERTTTTLAAPVPVGDTYYLLQAQISQVVTLNENRDVFDPGTGVFVPTPVDKRREFQITFGFKAGTSVQVPDHDSEWVPIAAIFRPGGGGAVAAEDVRDMRPLWIESTREIEPGDQQARVESYYMRTFGTGNVNFDFSAYSEGKRLFAKGSGVALGNAEFLDPGTTITTRDYFYIYLVRPRDDFYRNGYTSVDSNCLLVVSDVAPDENGTNGSSISLPTPFLGISSSAGDAILVGVLFTLGTSFIQGVCSRKGEFVFDELGELGSNVGITQLTDPLITATDDLNTVNGGREAAPYGVDVIFRPDLSSAGTGATTPNVIYRLGGLAASEFRARHEVSIETSNLGFFPFMTVPMRNPLATERTAFTQQHTSIAGTAEPTINLYVMGWRF